MLTAAVLLSSAFAGGGARVASPRAARGHVSCSIPLLPIDPEAAVAAATAAAAAVGADPLAAITAAMPAGLEAAGIDPLLAAGVGAATASAVLANSLNEPQTQGMPALYDGWFNGQIEAGARGAVAAAHRAGIRQMEVSFPPVPNLEEVAYGTVLNQKFLKGVAAELGLDAKKTALSVKRNPVEYANAAWARRIARACSGTAVIASQADLRAAKKPPGSVREITLTARPEASSRDTLIAVNPIGRWKAVDASHDGDVVMLNSAFSENYDLGGPIAEYEQVYFLKRISKGWVYRGFPGKWQAYIERPDGSVELLQEYAQKPSLRTVSELVRTTSLARYGFFNDRYAKGFGGRL